MYRESVAFAQVTVVQLVIGISFLNDSGFVMKVESYKKGDSDDRSTMHRPGKRDALGARDRVARRSSSHRAEICRLRVLSYTHVFWEPPLGSLYFK